MAANHITEALAVGLAAARAAYRAPVPRAAAIPDADREDAIRDKAREHYRTQRAAINAGADIATKETGDSLLEFFDKAPEYQNLVRTALSCDAAVTGAAFQALLRKVMLADAEAEALRELRQQELERED